MKLRYVGPYDAVLVPLPLGGEAEVEHGGELSTSAEHGESLADQVGNWEPVAAAKKGEKVVQQAEGDESGGSD